MIRFTRLFTVFVLTLTILGVLAAPTLAKPGDGNAAASTACADGGYLDYTDANGAAFKNEGQCTSYAAQGNRLVPVLTPCEQAASDAGFTNLAAFATIFAGNDGNDIFTPTGGADLFCGFGGQDTVYNLDVGDVFLGGTGNDSVQNQYGGTFNGGEGDDSVYHLFATFNGGAGNDFVAIISGARATFNGGEGDDSVNTMYGGTFNQE